VVAAVELYRVLTCVPPMTIGVCLLVWRRLGVLRIEPGTESG
jgi:hypothetical protein